MHCIGNVHWYESWIDFLGHLYFQTRKDEEEHLAMMIKASGPIPRWMAERTKGDLRDHFKKHSGEYATYNWPLPRTS